MTYNGNKIIKFTSKILEILRGLAPVTYKTEASIIPISPIFLV